MSSGWKNPFMKDFQTFEKDNIDKDMEDINKHLDIFIPPVDGKKLKPNYTKDLRYNSNK